MRKEHKAELTGKTIKSIKESSHGDDCLDITFTDGSKLCIEAGSAAGHGVLSVSYKPTKIQAPVEAKGKINE